jgi:hypothetical protein
VGRGVTVRPQARPRGIVARMMGAVSEVGRAYLPGPSEGDTPDPEHGFTARPLPLSIRADMPMSTSRSGSMSAGALGHGRTCDWAGAAAGSFMSGPAARRNCSGLIAAVGRGRGHRCCRGRRMAGAGSAVSRRCPSARIWACPPQSGSALTGEAGTLRLVGEVFGPRRRSDDRVRVADEHVRARLSAIQRPRSPPP